MPRSAVKYKLVRNQARANHNVLERHFGGYNPSSRNFWFPQSPVRRFLARLAKSPKSKKKYSNSTHSGDDRKYNNA